MTKQFGKLKLHFSKRGIAYKWGDGDIHRLSFERNQPGDGVSQAADAADASGGYASGQGQGYYGQQEAYGSQYGQYDGQYDDQYDNRYYGGNQNYDAERGEYGEYGEPEEGEPYSGKYDFLYQNDWVMYALLVLLPPLGIWILWKRNRFDILVRAAVSAVSAIWFILMLVWLFSAMFHSGAGTDQTTNFNLGTVPQVTLPATTPSPEATLPGGTGTESQIPNTSLPPSNNGNTGNTGNTGNSGNTGDTGNTGNTPAAPQNVYSTATGSYYHRIEKCTNIPANTPVTSVTLAVAQGRGQQPCPVCYAEAGQQQGKAKYWATRTGKNYHVNKTCSGMKGAVAYTKAQAVREGKDPCPICIGNLWMTSTGKYYHTKSNCSGMQNAKRTTKANAKAKGKTACPVCIGKKKAEIKYYSNPGGTYYHTKANCSGMKDAQRVTKTQAAARKQKPCPICVSTKTSDSKTYYATTSGTYYHAKSNCSGMKGAAKITLATAKKRGQKPCPVCLKGSSSAATYYATDAGAYYHVKSDCSGMKGAKKITLATAKKKGKTACPVCIAKKTQNTYVYTTSAGKYYHSKNNCSGMKGAKKVTLAAAKKDGKTACPVCMKTTYYYTTTSNRYYHKKSGCSGMKNASKVTLVSAKGKGKLACPVCVTGKAKPSDMKTYAYATSGGRYYHKNKTCQGIKNAKKITLAYAKATGKTRCPVCFKKSSGSSNNTTRSADSKISCFLIKGGTYYHATRNCDKLKGKSNVKKTSVATAKNKDYAPCPDCVDSKMRTYVYVIPTGLLYHRTAGCSGMKNPMKLTLETALNRAYKRCTKCNAPAAK